MANNSDARGIVKLGEGNWTFEDAYNLVYVLMSQDNGNYFIHFPILEYACSIKEDGSSALKAVELMARSLLQGDEVSFYGSGRWSMQNNLESLHNWSSGAFAKEQVNHLLTGEQYDLCREALINSMKNNNLTFEWDFLDYEPGVSFLYKQLGYHHVNDALVLEYIYSQNDTEYFEPNLKNYCEIFCDGDEEALGNAAWEIAKELQLDQQIWVDPICELIKKHSTWYDLGEGGWYEGDLNAIPEQLGKDVMRLVNEGHI